MPTAMGSGNATTALPRSMPAHDPPGRVVGLEQERHREPIVRGQVGTHEAGADRDHGDPQRLQIDPQRLEHVDHRRLGRAVPLRPGEAAVSGQAGHAHDRAGAAAAHARKHRFDSVDEPHHVGVEVPSHQCRVPRLDQHLLPERRVHDRDVDLAQLLRDAGRGSHHGIAVGHIHGHRQHGAAQLGRDLLELLAPAGADRHPMPGRRVHPCQLGTDTARRPGHPHRLWFAHRELRDSRIWASPSAPVANPASQ